jgi:hypothetical protein
MPTDGFAVRVIELPATTDGEAGDIVADSVGLMTNWADGEVVVTGVVALSVTSAQ